MKLLKSPIMNRIQKKLNFLFKLISKISKSKEINIVTLSSYSTQLGFLVASNYHFAISKRISDPKSLYLLFIFPSTADKKLNNILKNNPEKNNSNNFIKIKINSIPKRLLVSPALFCLFILNYWKKIYLWQTRYRWINDALSFKSSSIKLPVPFFKKILFGDGFLNLMPFDKPSWLVKKNESKASLIKNNDLHCSYHLFDIQDQESKLNSIKINKDFVRNTLINHIKNKNDFELSKVLDYIFKLNDKKIKFNKGIFIFPTTTFAETNRTTIDEEIEMYINYLKKCDLNSYDYLLIKPHPGSQKIKNKTFYEKLKNNKSYSKLSIIDPYPNYSNFCLGNIPLEIICTYIIEYMKPDNLTFACCSTATLSTKNIFPEVNVKKAFGSSLIRKYIDKDFIDQRLAQESMIEKKINLLN